jgi:hypothetical protein
MVATGELLGFRANRREMNGRIGSFRYKRKPRCNVRRNGITNIKEVAEMSKAGVEAFAEKAMADETFRRKIKENPEAALAGYDLTSEEKAAIKSGNAAQLRALGVDERITKSAIWQDPFTGGTHR